MKMRADTHNQQRPKWKQENKLEFLNNIDKSKINVLCNQIHDARVNINLVTKETITDKCNQISNIFMEFDSLTYQDRYNFTENSCNENKNNKWWFRYQCQSARRKYHLAKKIHSKYPTQLTRSNLNQASK